MKTVLITGASRGIGAQTARLFAQNGYAVAINYCHSKQEAEQLAEELTVQGCEAFSVYGDVANETDVKSMVQHVLQRCGHIDVLVLNAGIAQQKLLTDTDTAEWRQMIGVHLDSAYFCSKAVIPDMVSRKKGRIITISSMWGVTGASCEVAYSAAKAGVIGFTKALAKELGPSGITVNCVAPGVIDTDMCASLGQDTKVDLAEETPLSRLGTTQDVAETIAFLASDRAAFITGQVVGVNGGLVI